MKRLLKEILEWRKLFTQDALNAILATFATFTGSVLPELPDEIRESPLGILNPHGGGRDLLSKALLDSIERIGCSLWKQLAVQLDISALAIKAINAAISEDLLQKSTFDAAKYEELFQRLMAAETPAYSLMEGM
jgi:hypothetical protein